MSFLSPVNIYLCILCSYNNTSTMAWPNPLARRTAQTRTAWGYTFELTPEHLTIDQMQPMKHTFDVLGEQAFKRLNEISPPADATLPRKLSRHSSTAASKVSSGSEPSPESKRDLYALLRDNAERDKTLSELWSEVTTVPSWVDWDQIARGQDCFYRYGGPILTGLAFQSLLGGMVYLPIHSRSA